MAHLSYLDDMITSGRVRPPQRNGRCGWHVRRNHDVKHAQPVPESSADSPEVFGFLEVPHRSAYIIKNDVGAFQISTGPALEYHIRQPRSASAACSRSL